MQVVRDLPVWLCEIAERRQLPVDLALAEELTELGPFETARRACVAAPVITSWRYRLGIKRVYVVEP